MTSRGPFQPKWFCDTCAWLWEITTTSVSLGSLVEPFCSDLNWFDISSCIRPFLYLLRCNVFAKGKVLADLLLARILGHLLARFPSLYVVLGLGSTSNSLLLGFGWNKIEKLPEFSPQSDIQATIDLCGISGHKIMTFDISRTWDGTACIMEVESFAAKYWKAAMKSSWSLLFFRLNFHTNTASLSEECYFSAKLLFYYFNHYCRVFLTWDNLAW